MIENSDTHKLLGVLNELKFDKHEADLYKK